MLVIEDLHAKIDNKEILRGINLVVKPGEVHAIMGPNGSGKSTLSAVLAGNDKFEVTEGDFSVVPVSHRDSGCEYGQFYAHRPQRAPQIQRPWPHARQRVPETDAGEEELG